MNIKNDEFYPDDSLKVIESKKEINILVAEAKRLSNKGYNFETFEKHLSKNFSQNEIDIIRGILSDYEYK